MKPFFILIIAVVGVILFIVFVVNFLKKFLIKAAPGQALVKTGFGMHEPRVSLSSAFVIPLIHKVESIDLTVKTVRIARRGDDSLSCADGIRAEVEVDFYIKINAIEEDIRKVAMTVGSQRASQAEQLRLLFEAKFADALKTAGSKLKFDELYQNRGAFRDEILKSLGLEGNADLILNGYRLDDVAIQYLEQLPLANHNPDNVLDARGRKVIAERTSVEAEAANLRLRQKEVTIATQNRDARTKELEINRELAEKEAIQEREISEARARQSSAMTQTLAEQEKLAAEARINNQKAIRIAEERKEQETLAAQIARQKAIEIAEYEKQRDTEIAKIQKEMAEAEANKEKLRKLEETARQLANKIKADEEAETVRQLEIANRNKQIEVILAQKQAEVEKQARNVSADVKAYELQTIAKANVLAAEMEAEAATKKAMAILEISRAEAEAKRMKLEAENMISDKVILNNVLQALIPLLPEIVEKLMLPAEKIDSIKILNIAGMQQQAGENNGAAPSASNGTGNLINTVLNMGMLLPVLKEVFAMMRGNDELIRSIKELPGGNQLLQALENARGEK
jgi:uncharacterized membrane protein YqiK